MDRTQVPLPGSAEDFGPLSVASALLRVAQVVVLQVGTNELLLDDSVRPAERARDADVDVTVGVPTYSRPWPIPSMRPTRRSTEQLCS